MIELVLQFVIAAIATLAFAVLFSAPKSELVICGINGAIGWIIYYWMTTGGYDKVLSSGIATVILMILSRIFAVRREMPVTVYILPGIFPLVPGAGIYYTAYYMFTNDLAMGSRKGVETFEIAGAMVIGMIFGSVLPQAAFNKLRKNPMDNTEGLSQENRNFPSE